MSVDEIGDELYELPLDEFIGARNARAKELAASGDRDSAAVVRKLSKPSLAAWMANVLVRKHPDEIDELLDLGRELRTAQSIGAGGEMRRLSTRRQELVQRLMVLASADATDAGHQLGVQVERQLEGTLEAAVADQSASQELRAGRLTDALSHVGFGDVATLRRGARERSNEQRRDPEKRSGAVKPTSTRRGESADPRALADAERALAKSRAALESAGAELDEALRRHHAASIRKREAAIESRTAERELAQASAALYVARERRKREEKNVKLAEQERRRRAAGSRPKC
jgi:hypothetical protein